jgi:hypothetical protein
VSVAVGDVNGDGVDDIVTGAGPGGGPHVKVFDGRNGALMQSFFAFDPTFRGGVSVAAADLDGDGRAELVVGAMAGAAPHVKVFDADGSLRFSFLAYDASFTGGVSVAVGDVNGDGVDDIVTGAGPGGGPHVKVFDGRNGTEIASLLAYDTQFRGGVRVAAADLDGDGRAEIIAGAMAGAAPHVKVFDARTLEVAASFLAYDARFPAASRSPPPTWTVTAGPNWVTGAGPGGGPHVKVFDGRTGAQLASMMAYDARFPGGVSVAAADLEAGSPQGGLVRGRGRQMTLDGSALAGFEAFDAQFLGGVFVG